MVRLVLIATFAVLATACSSSSASDVLVPAVMRALKAAHLEPQKVKLVTTIETDVQTPLPRVNFCAAEAVAQPSGTSLAVEHGRAIVIVFESRHTANEWTPMSECGAKPLRVDNIIAVPTHGRLSKRLRETLLRLE